MTNAIFNVIATNLDKTSSEICDLISEAGLSYRPIKTVCRNYQRNICRDIENIGNPFLVEHWNSYIEELNSPWELVRNSTVPKGLFYRRAPDYVKTGQLAEDRLEAIRLTKDFIYFAKDELPLFLTKAPEGIEYSPQKKSKPVTLWDKYQQAGYLQCDLPQGNER